MKFNRISLAAFAAGMFLSAGSVCAQEVGTDRVAAMQEAASNNTMTTEEVATFLESVEPRLRGNHEGLKQVVAAAQADAASEAPSTGLSQELMKILMGFVNDPSMTPEEKYALVQEYMVKVLPLYNWLMTGRDTPANADMSNYSVKEIFHAPVDGAYYGIGDERNEYHPYGMDVTQRYYTLSQHGKLKRSGSYVWGMCTYNGKLYWSTNTNYMCVPGYAQVASSGDDTSEGLDNGCWVCEYKYSSRANEVVNTPNGPQALGISGDIQVPRIFCYDPKTNVTEDITPKEGTDAYDVLRNCQGLRSAYSFNDLVFFGGPALVGGSNTAAASSAFVCYDPAKGEYIGSSDMSDVEGCQVTNVRRWVEIDGILYCSVGIKDKTGSNRGAVLRWYGSYDEPFKFRIVGWTACEAAEIEKYNGRLWVGGWPVTAVHNVATGEGYPYAEVYRGPVIPEGGLTPEKATEWERVWRFQDYQNLSTYTSSMRAYKGKLYWGMFGSTFGSFYAVNRIYGENYSSPNALAYMLGNMNSTSFWRLDDTTGSEKPAIELLYGEETIPKNYGGYGVMAGGRVTPEPDWRIERNGMGLRPKWGRSGYGNLFTAYTWALELYHDKLLIGTMDMSNLIEAGIGGTSEEKANMLQMLTSLLNVQESERGFECLVLSDPDKAPEYLTTNGFKNPMSYGIRNFTVIGDDFYIGSANPHNIHSNGGWNVFRINDGEKTPDVDAIDEVSVADEQLMMQKNEGYTVFYTADGEHIDNVTVADVAGRVVGKVTVENHIAYVWTDGLAAGTYIATVKSGKNTWNAKFIVK